MKNCIGTICNITRERGTDDCGRDCLLQHYDPRRQLTSLCLRFHAVLWNDTVRTSVNEMHANCYTCTSMYTCSFKSLLPVLTLSACDKALFIGKLWWKNEANRINGFLNKERFYWDTYLPIFSTRWPKPNFSITFHEGIEQYHSKLIKLNEMLNI